MTTTHPPESSNEQLERLSDQALLHEFSELVRRDHHHVASLLRHIDVIDRRKLWATQGYSSLFAFLVGRCHMSESTAVKRIGAARIARRFPLLFTMVARGEIHLSGIHCIQAHLTPENHQRVLAAATHKTMRQLEELVAQLAPKPDVPATLRKLPDRPSVAPALAAAVRAVVPGASVPPALVPIEAASAAAIQPAPPAGQPTLALGLRRDPDPKPLAPGRYKLVATISQSARDKLDQLRDLLAYHVPKGDLAAIIERAFDALLVQLHKRKTGITAKPRTPKPQAPTLQAPRKQAPEPQALQVRAPKSQAPQVRASESSRAGRPALKVSVRRKVWPRDEARCGFVGADGHRCNATFGLQFAHRQPWAKGGADTADNICLRCAAHNALEADRDYGTHFMANKRQQKRRKVRKPLARYVVRAPPRSEREDLKGRERGEK